MTGLKPFFSFYGGKFRAAPRYPSPTHGTIIEPFAGSAGYSLRHPGLDVRLYDLDERIIATWQYLIKASERDIRSLPLVQPDGHIDDLNVGQEQKWLIGWWLNKGMTTPCLRPSKWMREPLPGRLETYWGAGVRERIARQVTHIRHWSAELCTYQQVPCHVGTWFIDPPYCGPPGLRYRHSNRLINYAELAEWCRGRPGQTVVCESAGANWLPFQPFMTAKATAGRTRIGVSHEAIWSQSRPRAGYAVDRGSCI